MLKCWRYNSEQYRHDPCLQGDYSLVGNKRASKNNCKIEISATKKLKNKRKRGTTLDHVSRVYKHLSLKREHLSYVLLNGKKSAL